MNEDNYGHCSIGIVTQRAAAHRITSYNVCYTKLLRDKDEASKISDEFLAKAISQWIYWSEKKDMAGFYKYMRDLGYIKEVEYKADCAWVLVDIEDFESAEKWELQNKHEVYDYEHSYSRGSYSAKTISYNFV